MRNDKFVQKFSLVEEYDKFKPLWESNIDVKDNKFRTLKYCKNLQFPKEENFYFVFYENFCIKVIAPTATKALERFKDKDVISVVPVPSGLTGICTSQEIQESQRKVN